MVEDVESFRPKLQLHILVNRKLTTHSQIHLPRSEASCKVTRSIAETGIYVHECAGVNCPASRTPLARLKITGKLVRTVRRSSTPQWFSTALRNWLRPTFGASYENAAERFWRTSKSQLPR